MNLLDDYLLPNHALKGGHVKIQKKRKNVLLRVGIKHNEKQLNRTMEFCLIKRLAKQLYFYKHTFG